MAGQVTPFAGKLPAIFQSTDLDADDLSAGVGGGFAVISFRGSKWRIKYQGEEHLVKDEAGDPKASLEVVIVRANPHITKNYYENAFTEGAAEAPDCYSLDGIRPEESAPKKQAKVCASCPKNVFGSRITTDGKPSKAKACQDNRRLAIVPVNDIENEMFGGPMLLRIPAASLSELALMGKNLKARGFPYNSVSVKLSFDTEVAYPKIKFQPIRPLTDDEGAKVVAMLNDEKLHRILAEAVEITAPEGNGAAPAAAAEPVVEKDPLFAEPVSAKAKPAKTVASKAAKPAASAPPADDLAGDTTLDTDIKGILAELGDLGTK